MKKDVQAIDAILQSIKSARWIEVSFEDIASLNGALAQILSLKDRIEKGLVVEKQVEAPMVKQNVIKANKK